MIVEKVERISCLVIALTGTTAEKDRIEADRKHLEEVCIQVSAHTHQEKKKDAHIRRPVFSGLTEVYSWDTLFGLIHPRLRS